MVLHFVLASPCPHRGKDSTHQGDSIERPLQQRNVAEALEQAHAIRLCGCRCSAAGQYDEWKVRPRRLACNPLFQSLRSATQEGLLGHQRGRRTLAELHQQVVDIDAHDAIELTFSKML